MGESPQRIQKVIARGGTFSRRQVEQLLVEKRIVVNGKTAHPGCKITDNDRILIDGKPVKQITEPVTTEIIAYNKRAGEICSRKEKPSVYDALPDTSTRWMSVGRLDINTSGLLLFCNQGDITNQLMHPSSRLDREYAVRVRGQLTQEMETRLTAGIRLEDGDAAFLDIVDTGGTGTNHWYHVVVQEGRHRLIRRLIASQGLEVSRLIRVRFGTIILRPSIRPGKWIRLDRKEVKQLCLLAKENSSGRKDTDNIKKTPKNTDIPPVS